MRLIILSLVLLCGCAGGGSSGGAPAANKSLWSNWSRTDGTFSLNLTGGSLGTNLVYTATFTNGATCSCNLTASGTEAAGNYTLSNCSYGGGGTGNPGCASLNSSGTFSKTSTQLSICDPTCATYN